MRKPPLFSLLVCAALQLLGCFVRGQEAPDVPVTPIGTVSRLSEAEATEGKPVRVRGVVTYTAPNHWYCIVQDDTGSIVVVGPRERPSSGEFRMGVVAELEGVTAQGRLHPFIAPPKGGPIRVSIVGEGTIPEPHVIPMADLQRRAFQAVRVEVSGVVRSVKTELFANTTSKLLLVTIADEQRRLTVALPGWRSADVPSNLVGAKVRARGVFQANLMGPASQLTYRLLITDLTDLQVDGEVKPPFDLALSSIRSAFYSANRGQTNRVHVKGLLTASLGGKGYYLEDKSGAIFISVPESSPKVGESVEVTGFEVVNRGQVALENTVWRSVSPPISIVPPRVTTAAMRDGKLDGRLVQIEALLLTVSSTNEGSTLVLQEGERVFVARFAMSHTPPPSLSDGSWLRLTGICINTTAPELKEPAAAAVQPASFYVLLPEQNSVEIAKMPTWWTFQRVAILFGSLLVFTFGAIVWATRLRRRVGVQRAQIREHLAREAVAEERIRIARELHDSVQQDLLGITMQIKATERLLEADPGKARSALNLASAMVRRSQTETHRAVWDLRGSVNEQADLRSRVLEVLDGLRTEDGAKIEFHCDGECCALPAGIESQLLRVAQEAVTNALKHAHASRIDVELRFGKESVALAVRDDGRGFDADQPPSAATGHFGLFGMRERAIKLNADLRVTSRAGQGTSVEIEVPVGASPG